MIRLTDLLFEQTRVTDAVYRTEAASYTRQQLPSIVDRYNPNSGYLVITDGNPWLAEQRARNLASFLAKNVESQVKIPFNKNSVKVLETAVSKNKGDEYQYVEGTLYAIMEKPPIPEEQYANELIYNFYEISGVPHIVVSKPGLVPPKTYTADQVTKGESSIINQFNQSAAMKEEGAKLVKQSTGGGSVSGPSEFTYGILLPIPKNYAERKGARVYFNDPESLNQMRTFIAKYTDGNDEFTADRPENKNANYLTSIWTKTQGGGGNLYFGKGNGAASTVVAGDTSNKDITIVRIYAKGSGEGRGAKAGTGVKGEWVKIGEFNLTKAEGAFADNMIKVQPGAYQKIFNELKTAVEKYTAAGLQIIEISATVKGYASADRATNRTNIGTPDHAWGVGFPSNKWITK
jgi:hypothetical protein